MTVLPVKSQPAKIFSA